MSPKMEDEGQKKSLTPTLPKTSTTQFGIFAGTISKTPSDLGPNTQKAFLDIVSKEAKRISKIEAEKTAKKVAPEISKIEAEKTVQKAIYASQYKSTEILGIFVAFFTFVSVEIQIFNRITYLSQAILFSVLVFLCMIGFLFFLHLILSLQNPQTGKNTLIVILLPFISLITIIVASMLGLNHLTTIEPLSTPENSEIDTLKQRILKNESDIDALKGIIYRTRK